MQQASQRQRPDENIVFPIKTFVGAKAYVTARATLSADRIAHKNNTYSFLCIPEECTVANVDQIGPTLMSSINVTRGASSEALDRR
jgi:hypothetical protein